MIVAAFYLFLIQSTSATAQDMEIVYPWDLPVAFASRAPVMAAITGYGSGMAIWNTETWTLKTNFRIDTLISEGSTVFGWDDWAISPDGSKVALITKKESIALLSTASGKEMASIPNMAHTVVNQLAFTPDGSKLLIAVNDEYGKTGGITVWTTKGKWLRRIPVYGDFCISPDSLKVVVASGNTQTGAYSISLFRISDGQRVQVIHSSEELDGPIAFSPDGHLIAMTAEDPKWPGPDSGPDGGAPSESAYQHQLKLNVWNVPTGKRILSLPGLYEMQLEQENVFCRFSSDDRYLTALE